MRFNPPPNWPPVPPGWTPPAGWHPDPSWPPPPAGWPLWVPERNPGRRTAVILGAVVAVLLIAGAAVVTVAVTRDGQSAGTHGAPPTTASALSDEDQIEKVVAQFEQAWNGQEFDNLRNLMCAEMRSDEQFSRANFAEMRDEMGTLSLTVTSIEVTGETADTVIDNDGTDPDNIAFAYENGQWKWCEL